MTVLRNTIRRFVLGFLAVGLAANGALAQRNCKKGIPCGGSCISARDVCHVGGGSSSSAPMDSAVARAKFDSAMREHQAFVNGMPGPTFAAVIPLKPVWDSNPQLSISIQAWSGHRVKLRGSMPPVPFDSSTARLALIWSDRIVIRMGEASLVLSYGLIDAIYTSGSPAIDTTTLILALKPHP